MNKKEQYFNIRSKDVENAKGRVEVTENKITTDKKSLYNKRSKNRKEIKEKRMQSRKNKQMRKKRLIIRNLSFKISEDELKKIFSKFGEVLDVIIPIRQDGKKRGFAFVQYKDTKSQIKAMKEMNFKEILGRPIAIDFAVDKTTYQTSQNIPKPSATLEKHKLDETASNISEESEDEDIKSENKSETICESDDASDATEDQEDSKVKAFFEEFDANKQENSDSESSDKSSDDAENDDGEQSDSDQNFDEEEESNSDAAKKLKKKKRSEDISEGKTVFIRNISYNCTEEDLQEVVQNFGDIHYCLFCMDTLTGQFKGSAFVKFKDKECADKLIQESSKEPGIMLQSRPLNCTYALSREDLSKQNIPSKTKDKRNLNLLKCGLIGHGSKEAEGVSKTDMAKRAQLESSKKQKLRNVNFFVSDKRLMVHNLPKNINDKDLWVMFKKAAGKEATIKEARVMKDFKKTDAQGVPVSRGFGFVAFTQHEHALKALMELNNNPRIFTSYARPIVEFSVENKVALLSQEKKRERLKMKNKKKIEERILSQSQEPKSDIIIKGKKIKNSQQPFSKDGKANNSHSQKKKQSKRESPPGVTQEKSPKKKQKKHSKSRTGNKAVINAQEKNNLSVLTNKYKEKLLNKYS